MRKKTIVKGFIFFATLAFLNSCIKTGTTGTQNLTKIDYLTKATWKRTVSRSSTNGGPWGPYGWVAPCQEDDIITFTKSNLFIWDQGSLLCNPTSPKIDTIYYWFNADSTAWNYGTSIDYSKPFTHFIYKLNNDTFLDRSIEGFGGNNLVEYTFVH